MVVPVPLHRRLLALGAALLFGSLTALPTATAVAQDGGMYARLELPRGDIDFELEPGRLQFFDEEGAPFALQVIDGCAVNDHYWIFGAGLTTVSAPLTVIDRQSGQSQRVVLPAYRPGESIPTVLDTEALPICRDIQTGGLPTLTGTGTYTAAVPRCFDSTDSVELLSAGSEDAYRTFIRNGFEVNRVIRDKPITTVDDSTDFDEIHLFAEGRTPRKVEGVVISGAEGMLPARNQLDKVVKSLTNSRVRRAFETAKNGRIPQGILRDLGVKNAECVHHVSLDMETLGADAYLAAARWIKDGGRPLALPQPVEDRFTVEVVPASGESMVLPLTGPLLGSDEAGMVWHYSDGDVQVQIVDACSLSGSFWTIAATETDEPLQLLVTDTLSGTAATYLLWTDRPEPASVADTENLPICG